MRYPEELHSELGTEFKGEVIKLAKEHNVPIKSVVTKYHHSFTAFFENFNEILAQRLFKPQDAQELRCGEDSKIWVKNLKKFLTNNTKLKRIGMTPAKAIKLENVDLKIKPYKEEKLRLLTVCIDTCLNQERKIVIVKDVRLIITGQERRLG